MTDEQFEQLIEVMEEQMIPSHWQAMVISAMANSEKRFQKMMHWLKENKDKDYDSMDLVNAVIQLKRETPLKFPASNTVH